MKTFWLPTFYSNQFTSQNEFLLLIILMKMTSGSYILNVTLMAFLFMQLESDSKGLSLYATRK